MSEPENQDLSIAVIGMAGRFPGASDLDAFWSNLRAGVESIRAFTHEELAAAVAPADLADPAFVPAGAVLDDVESFDAAFFDFNPREAEITDPQQRLFLECCWEALERAGVDPETAPGSIGVFAGSGMSTYFLYNVLGNPAATRGVAPFQLLIGADKDYLAPRVSYKLNLKGPSLSVQTACSTSLVAVHLACQSLQDYQSDVALAGGVSVRVPQKAGYLYQEGGIFSPDGHCRAFDRQAAGTVSGSGVGVVALKRLADALADGDPILAVIRGSAINNDGAAKVGFTAPSVEGQVAVVSEALSAAGVDAATIGYVEAHGTGTSLGDPIEVAALAEAFRGAGAGSCALGSVKTNLGHLDAAAGVAGLIKTVLALGHREIPPSLHYSEPNPAIDFSASPFYVNAALAPWAAREGGPRRAGVSSFGIGGTNAHAIVEEAPEREAPQASVRPWQPLVLSARTPSALEAMTEHLARHLAAHPEEKLADVAYTLGAGRKVFAHRRALICRDREDALAALSARDPRRLLELAQEARDRPVAFLFPGQGAQHVGMGRALYESEPAFRAALDECARLLEPHLGLDLRTVLFPAPGAESKAAARLERTALAQPALFAVEVSLARLWQEWGIRPAAMIGHSIGEYVAAHVAGVFSLADALALVAARGRLMDALPAGAMLAVPRPEAEVRALLEGTAGGVSLAAVNGPAFCTVSGPIPEIEALAADLARRGIEARRLHTSHAFHSAMMDPILEAFASEVAKVRLAPPKIPFVSNLTGTWIEAAAATGVEYWVRHLRETVRFGAGAAEIARDRSRLLLEVGPGRTLASLIRAADPERTVITSLPPPKEDETGGGSIEVDRNAPLAAALAQLWLSGARIDWSGFYRRERRRKLELPTYPFERQRYWIEPARRLGAVLPSRPTEEAILPEEAPLEPAAENPADGAARAGHARPQLATPFVAPAGDDEIAIAGLWERALGIAEIGVHDDFFELGGHSLLATQITADVRLRFGVDVELRPLFAMPTVAGMAGAIRDRRAAIAVAVAAGEEAPAIDAASTLPMLVPDPAHRFDPFPLTDVQQAYWIGRSGVFELGGVATHIYTEIDAGRIDLERMTRAWRLLVDRHDMLRAVISTDGRQRVLESVPPYEIRVADLRGKGQEGVNAGIGEVRRQMSHQVIPADRWPLFEVRASVRDGDRVRFHISFDFLIGDAWSWQLLTRDLVQLYLRPEAELPPLEVTFRDYVLAALAFEETPAFARDLAYWRARLADLPPAPELPLAHNPAALERPRFVRHSATLARADWQRLKERASRAGLTPSALLLAAYSEVLAAWSKNPRFAVNLTLFNRLPIHPQVGDVVGDFTSLTLLAIDASIPGSFVERAKRIQDRLWEDLDHRAVSGVRVLRELAKNGAARALMPVVFTSTLNLVRPWEGDDEEDQETLGEEGYGISQTPQVWIDHQVAEERGKLTYNWDVVEELFPPGLLASMFDAYRLLVERLASEDQVWSETRLDLAPPEQIAEQAAANRTEATFPVGANLLHRLVAAVPDEHPAIVAPGFRLGYGDLRRRARGLGSRLRDLGARPNRLVAVVMEKGWEQAVAVLGIHEVGAAYLPIDPDLPAERRAYLFEDGEVEIAVVQPEVEARIAAAGEWPEGLVRVAVAAEDTVADVPALEPAQAPADLAYVIFTSGSTGRPKGVMIDHRGAVNTVLDVNARLGLGPADRVLALSALSFDLSVWDIFGTLAAGGTIVYPAADRARDPEHWAERAESEGVTIWNSVPALFEMLVERAEAEKRPLPATLRATMLSGDWIPVSLPGRARALLPNGPDSLRLISMGGATEASIWSIWFEIGAVDPSWRSIPYGRAMANQSFHVVDDRFAPRPTWVPGHLAIGGIGLALGYWRDPEKTAASFVVDPRTGARYYWTGDLGRALPGGDLEFLGREDFQVKIRGFRVELGEIEAALARQPGVREAVVLARDGNAPGEKRLAAFLIADPAADSESAALEVSELRAALRAALPDYMVPSSFTMIDAFPLTANGKVDRRALPALAGDALGEERQYVAPRSDVEASLAAICAEALGVSPLGVHDDFFALGGDSLMAIRAVFRIRKAVGVELPVRTFFDRPTVAGLAEAVEDLILAEIEAMSEAEVEEQL